MQEPQSWRWLWVFIFLWVGLESRREDSCVCFVKNVFDFSTFRGCFYWVSNCRFWSSLPRCWKGPFHPLWGTATQGAYLTAPLKLVCLSPQFTFGCLLVRLSAVFLFGRAIPRLDLKWDMQNSWSSSLHWFLLLELWLHVIRYVFCVSMYESDSSFCAFQYLKFSLSHFPSLSPSLPHFLSLSPSLCVYVCV